MLLVSIFLFITILDNLLERLLQAVDFEMFRETPETGFYKKRMKN